jgi:hypothetical protein
MLLEASRNQRLCRIQTRLETGVGRRGCEDDQGEPHEVELALMEMAAPAWYLLIGWVNDVHGVVMVVLTGQGALDVDQVGRFCSATSWRCRSLLC